jgi:RNA polymerase sigma factor (sigma-70 family)
MTPDGELLRAYAETNSEDSFSELVRRHLDLVYSAALRRVNGDAHLAHDVAQTVFTDLARKAASLSSRPVLTGWLYTSALFAAAKTVRTESRRHARERDASLMHELLHNSAPDLDWEKLSAVLDDAMLDLKEPDREAVLLRYFENRPHAEIASRLGLTENAGRMKVERALEKLRGLLKRRGVNTAASLSMVISANAVQAAPVGLSATISSAAIVGVSLNTAATITLGKTIIMTTAQKIWITSAIVVAGAAVPLLVQQSNLRKQDQVSHELAAQSAPSNANTGQLPKKVMSADDSTPLPKEQFSELLRLRGQVGVLRAEKKDLESERDSAIKASAAKTRVEPTAEIALPKESWTFAGYGTPENTLQSVLWAQTKGDLDTFMAALCPEAQNEFKSAMQRKAMTPEAMMATIAKVKDITILKKVSLAEDLMLLRVRNQMQDGTENFTTSTLKLINGEWKVQSGRAE